ncbi:MAG: hypothetical protein ACUVV1_10680, partial [Fimbriimonadales bacterium]
IYLPRTLNGYGYCLNEPIGLVDPSGQIAAIAIVVVGALVLDEILERGGGSVPLNAPPGVGHVGAPALGGTALNPNLPLVARCGAGISAGALTIDLIEGITGIDIDILEFIGAILSAVGDVRHTDPVVMPGKPYYSDGFGRYPLHGVGRREIWD